MANLLVGPLLRYVGSTQATVWVETDAPCEVTVLGHRRADVPRRGPPLRAGRDRRPRAGDRHAVRRPARRPAGLAARGRATAEHDLHAEPRASGPPRVRVLPGRRAGGAAVHALELRGPERGRDRRPLGVLEAPAEGGGSRGPTACCCSATRCTPTRSRPRPSRSPARGETYRSRPGEEVADFEEYTRLYRESWDDPDVRWLLSTVPSTMIFDDHDVHDDWNISWSLDRRRCAAAVVGGAHRRRVHVLLALPAPREPRPARARRGARCTPSSERTRTEARGCERSRTWPTASRRRAAGRSTATSARRASWSSTPVRRACSPMAGATWSTRRSGTGSSSTRAATTTT